MAGLFDDLIPPPPAKRSLFAVANDTVIEGANAAAGAVKSGADFISPGNRFSQFIQDEFITPGEQSQSDAAQQSRRQFQQEVQDAEGFMGEVGAVGRKIIRDPLLTAAQAAGSFVLPGAAIKGAGALAGAAGAGAAGVARAGLAGGAAAGAALSGGDAAGQAYELAKNAGATEQEAVAAARQASVIPAAVGGVGGVFGAERLFAGAGGKQSGGILARMMKTGGSEALQGGVEEGVTNYEGQRAAMPFDSTIDPMKGTVAAATMGAALGGITGAAVAAIERDNNAQRADASARLAGATTVDEMIAAATDLASPPRTIAPIAGFEQGKADAAMAAMEQQAKDDQAAIKQQGRMDKTGLPGRASPSGAAGRVDDGSAEFVDSPLVDRLTTIKSQLADEGVRQTIREQFGEDGLNEALYYANLADKANGADPIPDATRENMLGIAEQIVSRATAQPIPQQEGLGTREFTAPAQLGMAAQAPRIGLDTAPTGTMRVDAQGTAAPETRADVVSAADRVRAMKERRDGMTAQAPKGGTPGVGVMVGEGVATATKMPERAQPEPQPTLLLTGDGRPYGTRAAAAIRAKKVGGEVVTVEGGWAVRPQPTTMGESTTVQPAGTRGFTATDVMKEPANAQPDVATSTDLAPTAGDGRAPDADRSGGDLGPLPVDAGGAVISTADAPSRSGAEAVSEGAGDGGNETLSEPRAAKIIPRRKDNGSLIYRFKTNEDMDGQVHVSQPGWRKGQKSFEVSFDRTGGAKDDKGRFKFYPTVTIGKYRTEAAAIAAAEKTIAEQRGDVSKTAPETNTSAELVQAADTSLADRIAAKKPKPLKERVDAKRKTAAQATPDQAPEAEGGNASTATSVPAARTGAVEADGLTAESATEPTPTPPTEEAVEAPAAKTLRERVEAKKADPARAQELRNSITEGELILKAKKDSLGKAMSAAQLAAVQRSVDSTKAKLAAMPDDTKFSLTDTPESGKLPRYAEDTNPDHQRIAAELGKRISAWRDGFVLRAVEAPRDRFDLRAAAGAARAVAGQSVIFTEQPAGRAFNGVTTNSVGSNYVLLDVNSDRPAMAVLGHEVLHRLRAVRPDLYDSLNKRIETLLQSESKYADDLNARRAKSGLPALDANTMREELLADVFGDEWASPDFWRELGKEQPSGMRALADSIVKFLNAFISKITAARPFGTDRYLSDLKAARDAVVDATRQFSAGEVGTVQDGDLMFSVADPTDSAAFKKWFGNSKVTTMRGEPMVVYHGAADARFIKEDGVFKTLNERHGYNGSKEDPRRAFFFTDSRRTAATYADDRRAFDYQNSEPGVIATYLSIQNPLVIDAKGGHWRDAQKRVKDDVFAEAKEAGNDGVIIRNVLDDYNKTKGSRPVDVFVAFSSNQIKSATGNNGDFDPTNPDIRFSLAANADATLKSAGTSQNIRNHLSDILGSAGKRVSWWEKTIGTQYAKAMKHAEFRPVFEAVQKYTEDTSTLANEAANAAPSILPKLESWRDLKKSFSEYGLSTADAKAIAAPIFTGTLEDGKVYSDSELRGLFNLNAKQIGQYREFRKAVDTSLDQMVAVDVLRLLGDKNPALQAIAQEDRPAFRAGVDEFLTQQAAEARSKEHQDRLTSLRDEIREKYQRVDDLKAQGYAPLMRFGRYTINIPGADGESQFFGMYESAADANRAARELAEDPKFKGAKIDQGTLSEQAYKLFQAVPLDSLDMFANAIGAEQSAIYQEYIKLAKNNRSALKRLIKRKGTAGFSEDVPRVLASFVTSNARFVSGAINLANAKTDADNIRAGDLKDEAIKLLDAVQNPTDTASAIRGLMFMNFIGGSVASALVNVTQPVTMTLPYLSQFGGLTKATARLMSAAKQAAGGKIADPAIAAAMKRAEDGGIVSPQEIHHLTAEAMGSWGTNPLLKRFAFIWSAPFSLAEQFNRRVTFIAAYKTAQEQGIANPFAFAETAVIETQGLYNKGNAANLTRNAAGAMALQFKQYSTHYLEWLGRMWRSGPEGKRAVMYALALLMLAGGTDGLPFAEDVDDMIDTFTQALGINAPSKEAKRAFIASVLGDDGAEVMTRGLTSIPGVPIDLSLRMGMGNLLPATGLFLRSNTDRSRDVLEVAGASGGLVKQYMDAGEKALQGNFLEAGKAAVPVALQNVAKAMQMWETGEYRDTKQNKVMDVDATDGLMKALGFQPAEIARESKRLGGLRRSEQLAKNVEGEIAAKWARGFADGDQETVKEAREELADWNANNPETPIKITSAQILQRVRKMRQTREERYLKTVSPERRAATADLLQ